MNFIWEDPNVGFINMILTFVIIAFAYGFLFFMFFKIVKRKTAFIFLSTSFILVNLSYIFNLPIVTIVICCFTTVGLTVCLFTNLGDLRLFLANPFKRLSAKAAHFGVEKIYDRKALYKIIETAVVSLSKSRTGALITFEKNTSLKDIIKNGVPVNAPVSAELLTTIFYPGTRLHDGAVIIHGNEIIAASVFFTPTTKPFAGKYGSRHRAAIGISEICDAITVVVSEETGRISFAVNGTLESVSQDNFLRVFENYMDGVNEED